MGEKHAYCVVLLKVLGLYELKLNHTQIRIW